ncbi:MAG TPA: MarR family transcriptional regulator [Acidimicrobiales bacterium]|nr:MarR family transcriptional regulator [Acidimicrobiales bacterium]
MKQIFDTELEEAVNGLLMASRALVAVAARSLADAGDVTLPQFRALVVLSAQPGLTVSDLAAALDIHPTTATRLIDRLVRKRLVQRRELAEDRRITQLQLAAGGRRLVQRVTDRRARDLAEIAGRMAPESWRAVRDAMHEFALAAGEPSDIDLFGWNTPTP